MRFGDLLDREVVDAGGRRFGRVVDVRVELSAEPGPGTVYRVTGLVVGRRALGARLGLLRPEVHGPAILVRPARWLARSHDWVPWDRIERLEPDVVIAGEPEALPGAPR